jgi:hypothetical protein
LNGEPGRRVLHCKGVRQRDPLSPMLFLLVMEPLHILFSKAQDMGLLQRVSKGCQAFRVSLYGDDAAVFIKPTFEDLVVANCILQLFVEASGLVTNMTKTLFFPIQCQQVDLEFLNQGSHAISSFPCYYLGLPVQIKKLPKSMFELAIQ